MSVIPVDEPPGTADGASRPGSFWQKLAQALDEYFVDRTMRAVPESTLRRSKHEIKRYRRLLQQSSLAPAEARINRTPPRRSAQTQPR